MGIFLPGKQRKNRRFSYEPRFYNPERDENIKRRMRIESKVRRRTKLPNAIMVAAILLLAVYLYIRLGLT